MSMRRALDTGWSAWVALLFVVPGLSYVFMALMSVLPHRARAAAALETPRPYESYLPGALLAIAAGAALAAVCSR
jgi:hypothetical protein